MSTDKFSNSILGRVQSLRPWEVPVDPEIRDYIANLYNQIHGEGGEAFAEHEGRYINRAIIDDNKKHKVTPLSVFLAFTELVVKDLTLAPGAQALCYLLNRSIKLKDYNGNEYWENRVYIAVTGYGEILLRQRAGQIRHCDSPTVVYEGDEFGYREADGRKQVSYALNLNHNVANPIACFMKITRIDGSTDYAIILPEGWRRLQAYSDKQNGNYRNPLYASGAGGSIDPGFLIAKCVKHAFKNYPKLPIGRGMVMEADIPEEEIMPGFYGDTSEAPQAPVKPEQFAAPDQPIGVTVNPSEGNTDDDGVW